MADVFPLSDNLIVRLERIGQEQTPLLLVDNLLAEPEKLVSSAGDLSSFDRETRDFYPGQRKPLPVEYAQLTGPVLAQYLREFSVLKAPEVEVQRGVYSLASTAPQKLLPIQRIPHFDSESPVQWAMVHYLCDEQCGGTGFFRHRRSQYESITAQRSRRYQRMLEDEASRHGVPEAVYLSGDSLLFEMHHYVEAKFNRAIFYPGNLLHSGLVRQWQSTSLADARLTANAFLRVESR